LKRTLIKSVEVWIKVAKQLPFFRQRPEVRNKIGVNPKIRGGLYTANNGPDRWKVCAARIDMKPLYKPRPLQQLSH
jgi:hypothetical protein